MDCEKKYKLLVINPGSTSTKVSLFENERSLFEHSLFHDAPELLKFPHVNDQMPFRYQVIMDMLKEEGVDPKTIDVFVGRGGSACTQPGGVTTVDEKLYDDTVAAVGGSEHPAKLGVMLAWQFANEFGKPAYTLNPTNVDEYCDYARLTGIKVIQHGKYRYTAYTGRSKCTLSVCTHVSVHHTSVIMCTDRDTTVYMSHDKVTILITLSKLLCMSISYSFLVQYMGV